MDRKAAGQKGTWRARQLDRKAHGQAGSWTQWTGRHMYTVLAGSSMGSQLDRTRQIDMQADGEGDS